jgi:hypothetical protein
MNLDALSDLILVLVCATLIWKYGRQQPALGIAAGLVGFAGCFGVLRFSGVAELLGPHRFFSLVAAVAAFPLLASALRWPDAPSSLRTTAAGRFALVAASFGIVARLAGFSLWEQVVPGGAALLIAITMVQRREILGLLGATALLGSFAVAAVGRAGEVYLGFFDATQLMHYTLALALALLMLGFQRRKASIA